MPNLVPEIHSSDDNCLDMNKTDTITKQEKRRDLMLFEFRRKVQDILEPHHDDQFLEKWLIARDFNIIKAEKMIRESFALKKKVGVDRILTGYEIPEVFKHNKATAFLGYDKDNSAVRVFMIGICDFKGFLQSLNFVEVMRLCGYFLEYDLKGMEDRKKEGKVTDMKTTFILDFTGFSLKKFYNKKVINASGNLLTLLQDNYPEIMKTVYIVNVPLYFTFVFNIFKPFLSTATLSRLKVFSTDEYQEELRNLLNPKQIPVFLGGELTSPDGDPKCPHMLDWNTKIDPCYFLTNSDETEDSSLKTVTVQQRGVLEIPVEVPTSPMLLKWVLTSKEYNIRFGLFLRRGGKSARLEEVIPVNSVDCHILREENEFLCKKTGTYILYFDNSYSLMTAKQISYKVELEKLDPNDIDSELGLNREL